MRELNVDQIKKLWVLDLIVQSGSLKKAALRAKVSPSAISQSLSSLEKSVGKPLLIRERGTISPTSDAIAILEAVRPAFAALDRMRNLAHDPVPKLSWMKFGTYESMAIDVLPGLIHSLREKMPQLRLGLRISRTSNLLTMVRKGELCAALVSETDDLDKFYVKVVGEDRLGIFVSPKVAQVGWRAVEQMGYGSLAPSRSGFPRYYSKFLRKLDAAKPLAVSDSFESLRSAAAAGAIAAVLPHRVAQRSGGLVEIHSPKPGTETGAHKICVVSQASCDREETDFLAKEISRLLKRSVAEL